MTSFIGILSSICLIAGAFFALVGGIGLVRMPDFYTRMHAASVTDTLGAGLILIGLMLLAGLTLVSVKLAMIGLLTLIANPTATHALARAALLSGLAPKLGEQRSQKTQPVQRSGEEVTSSKP